MSSLQTSLLLMLASLTATQAARQQPRQTVSQSLLGPVVINLPSIQIDSISISLVTFADEVIDISGISIFGNVNDGTMNCTSATESGDAAVLGPVSVGEATVREINLSLLTFGDEVIDISNIAIFGDVNDVGCD
ncbi:hypothetical protein C8035_v010794 [Colletotrichum spinosum]|uniref:Uncharacterized protein n=1 Tax=Colletotrichum spinosum TaxID=1347390 RepID=A0A4V3HS64_9PEZI|nr:hypothetical protein C8035_v010794 [Colletotrichum spinosum]